MDPLSNFGAPRAVKFRFVTLSPPISDSNVRRISHKDVLLGNLWVNRCVAVPGVSDSGSCRATETAVGDRDCRTSSSLAPDERPESRIVRDRSRDLLLCLFHEQNQ